MGKNKIRLIAAALLLVVGHRGGLFCAPQRPRAGRAAQRARPPGERRVALEVIAFPGGEVRKFSGDEAEAAAAAARSLEYGGVKRKGGIRTEAGDYRVFIDTAGGPVWLFVRADGRGSVDCSGSFTVRVEGAGELYSMIDGLMKGGTGT